MSRGARKRGRRGQILEAAKRCLARYGFEKLTMDDVGREVGLNKASLYYYYRSKEALVSDVLTSEAKVYIDSLRKKVEAEQGCAGKIQTYLIERLRISQHVVGLHNMSLGSFRAVRPFFRKLHQQFKDEEVVFLEKVLAGCIEKGELAECEVGRVAKSIFTVAEAYKSEVLDNPLASAEEPVDYASVEEDLTFKVSLLLKGLLLNGVRSV